MRTAAARSLKIVPRTTCTLRMHVEVTAVMSGALFARLEKRPQTLHVLLAFQIACMVNRRSVERRHRRRGTEVLIVKELAG